MTDFATHLLISNDLKTLLRFAIRANFQNSPFLQHPARLPPKPGSCSPSSCWTVWTGISFLTLEFQLLYRPDDLSLQGFSRCWSNSPHHHPPRPLPARCLIEKAFVLHHWLVALAVRTDFLSERRNSQCGMNGGKRLRGCCPHPRAPGALALSLDRERDLEKQEEGIKKTQTRRMTACWRQGICGMQH
jgi:hypothetical protein